MTTHKKPHPWRQWQPGQFKSDIPREHRIAPVHARPVRAK